MSCVHVAFTLVGRRVRILTLHRICLLTEVSVFFLSPQFIALLSKIRKKSFYQLHPIKVSIVRIWLGKWIMCYFWSLNISYCWDKSLLSFIWSFNKRLCSFLSSADYNSHTSVLCNNSFDYQMCHSINYCSLQW